MVSTRYRNLTVIALLLAALFLFLAALASGCQKKSSEVSETGGETGGVQTGEEEVRGHTGIAFVRDDLVYLAEEDGSGAKPLTHHAAGYQDLAFSPSGARLAAVRVEGDAMPQLVVFEIESGKETEVSWTNEKYSGVWRAAGVDPWFGGICWADEDTLYCTAIRMDKGMELQVVRVDLSPPKVTVVESEAQNPALSPDGKKLAYIRRPSTETEWEGGMPGELILRDLGTGKERRLDIGGLGYYVFDAVFSPSGDTMAAVVFSEPDVALYVTDTDGKVLHPLAHLGPSGSFSRPWFSPRGDRLLVHRSFMVQQGEMPERNLCIFPAGEDNPRATELGEGSDPAWSPAR